MYTIESACKPVLNVSFSRDGQLGAEGNGDDQWLGQAWPLPPDPETAWSASEGECEGFQLRFDPRTGSLIHGSRFHGITSHDRKGSETLEVPGGPLVAFAISPSGDRLVCGCQLWNGRTKKDSVPDQLVSFARNNRQKHWDLWKQSAIRKSDGFAFSNLAFFGDGRRFASVEWSTRKRGSKYGQGDLPTLGVYDSDRLELIEATTFRGYPHELLVCGNNVVVRRERSFRVWNGDDLSVKPVEVKASKMKLAAIAADPQGRFVLTASGNGVSVWDANSWAVSKTYEWNAGKITCLAVSPDGLLAAAGTATGKVVVWDTE